MNIRFRHVLMEGEPGAPGGGTPPAPPAPGAPVVEPKAMGTALAPADPAAPSALSTGNEWTPAAIPEKFRVNGADGQLDLAATMRKVDEHRSSLEKRMGSGDIRPKTADEYKLPDTDQFKGLQLDEAGAKAFRQEAHDMGLSQKQYEGIMAKWATLAPELVQAGQKETTDGAVATLRETWKDQYDANIKESFRVVNSVAAKAGISFEEVEKAIGNNPTAIRLFAALGPEMREDSTPAAANGGTGGGAQSHQEYIAANWAAYSDPRNPQHAAVTQHANLLLQRQVKNDA